MNDVPAQPLMEARKIGKTFPGVRALHDVDLKLYRGEVLALIGENGAGKSTLMKILAGIQAPSEGQLYIEGQPVTIDSVDAALAFKRDPVQGYNFAATPPGSLFAQLLESNE